MGVLRVKDPADPTGVTWIEVAGVGGDGPPGADGALGPTGPTGPTGPAGSVLPAGGTTGQVLTKLSDVDDDVAWEVPWNSRVLGGGLAGSAHFRYIGGLVMIKFSVTDSAGGSIGDGQHIADFPAPPYALWFLGSSDTGAKIEFHMTALGQIYVRSGGAATGITGAHVYPRA